MNINGVVSWITRFLKTTTAWKRPVRAGVAVLIDVENVPFPVAEEAISIGRALGEDQRAIAFADWNQITPNLGKRYRLLAERSGLELEQVDRIGKMKNGSDIALAANAVRLSQHVDTMLIVTHDRDFMYLVTYLRNMGIKVYGAGLPLINQRLRSVFHHYFVYCAQEAPKKKPPSCLDYNTEWIRLNIRDICREIAEGENNGEWTRVSRVGSIFRNRCQDISLPPGLPQKMTELIQLFPQDFELQYAGETDCWVRSKECPWAVNDDVEGVIR